MIAPVMETIIFYWLFSFCPLFLYFFVFHQMKP